MRIALTVRIVLAASIAVSLAAAPRARAATWAQVRSAPRLITGSAVVEPRRHRLFLYGPIADPPTIDELWSISLDSLAQWQRVSATGGGPADRFGSTLLADPAHDRLLFFGGLTSRLAFITFANDLWELGLSPQPNWNLLANGNSGPTLGSSGSAVLDTRRNRVLAFGGDITYRLQTNTTNLTWEFAPSDTGWGLLPTTAPPPPRGLAPASYDSTADRMVVSGGSAGLLSGRFDTWELTFPDSGHWQLLPNLGTTPPVLLNARSWTDAAGRTLNVLSNDATIWSLDLARRDAAVWTSSTGPSSPHPGGGPAAWDESARALWQFDLAGAALWRLSPGGAPTWSLALPSPDNLPGRYGATRLVLDHRRDRAELLFGFNAPGGAPASVGERSSGATLTSWTAFNVAPSPRSGASVIRDELNDRLIVFGGEAGGVALADLWEYRPATDTWTALSPPGATPTARAGHTAVVDSIGRRMIVYGGWRQGSPTQTFADAWALSLDGAPVWTRLADAPIALTLHSAVWDERRWRMLVFGGHSDNGNVVFDSGDLWSYDPDSTVAWRLVGTHGNGHGLAYGHVALIEPARDRMLVFGGNATPAGAMRQSQLDLATLTWQPFATANAVNDDAQNLAGYLDAGRRQIVLAHSRTDGPMELWTLALDDTIPPVAVLLSTLPTSNSVQLSWQLGGDVVPMQIERQRSGGAPTTVANPTPDALGRVAYLDTDVVPGDALDYRLLGLVGGSATTLGTAHVSVPGDTLPPPPVGYPISLRVISPVSSAVPEALVSLPDASPARLELYDLTGRRVSRSEVGYRGPGDFRTRVAPDRTLHAGLYIVRLTRAGVSLNTRLVVVL